MTATQTELLSVNDLARRWHTSTQAIYSARYRGFGPPAIRVGRRLLWSIDDVVAWEAAQREDRTDGAVEGRLPPTAILDRRLRRGR